MIDLAAENAGALNKKPDQIKVAVVVENDPFSKDVRKGVVDRMKKYGMKLVVDDQLPRDLSDMSATLTKVKALKPDVLVISGHSKGAATGVRQIAEQHVDDSDRRHDPLRLGQDHQEVRQAGRIHPVRDPVGADADLQGQGVRLGGRLRQGVQGALQQ